MSQTTRRGFLESAAAAGAAPAAPAAPAARFAPAGKPRRISDSLWLLEDTASVYLVKRGGEALLIDFGSGGILEHLASLGVSRVDSILHTHHHRDQCQGDATAVARGIPIAVPAHEKHLFAYAENFWRNRRVFHLCYVRNEFNTLTRNVRVSRTLADYFTFRWKDTDFRT